MADTPDRSVDLDRRFTTFVAVHRDRAWRLAWRLVGGDEAAADDVTQDALVRAFRALPGFRDESKLETWFFRIVIRQAHSHRRWRALRELWNAAEADDAPDPRQHQPDPLLRERIVHALDRLPGSQRDAFVLVHLEGFGVRESAEIMGKAEGTVKSHLARALKSLRRELKDLQSERGTQS